MSKDFRPEHRPDFRPTTALPIEAGYRMPGEFEPHDACWMFWPERRDNWRDSARPAQDAFCAVAEAIIQSEELHVGVSPGQFSIARQHLPANTVLHEIEADDAWMRDVGPTFLVGNRGTGESGLLAAVDWEFNAWGGDVDGLYASWDRDDRVAQQICDILKIPRYRSSGFVMEGGAVHCDGEGTAYVTEACLLSSGRNPGLSKMQITDHLKGFLGVDTVVWIPRGIYLDETNEHVDNLLQVVEPGHLVVAVCEDPADPQYALTVESLRFLESQHDASGRRLKITRLPLPSPVFITEEESRGVLPATGTLPRKAGDRLAASYSNFYLANGAVIVPQFGQANADSRARDILAATFPDRIIRPVSSREILLGGGNIHCITQQQPSPLNR